MFQVLERAPGFETELGVQHLAGAVVDHERLALLTAAVERQHQLAAQPFTVGLRIDDGLQFTDQLMVSAQAQLGLVQILHDGSPGAFQGAQVRPVDSGLGQVGQYRPPPQRQRFAQRDGGGFPGARGEFGPALLAQALERVQVDGVLGHGEQVAGERVISSVAFREPPCSAISRRRPDAAF